MITFLIFFFVNYTYTWNIHGRNIYGAKLLARLNTNVALRTIRSLQPITTRIQIAGSRVGRFKIRFRRWGDGNVIPREREKKERVGMGTCRENN